MSIREDGIRSFVTAFPCIAVPHADAPTPDHFEFIARVADALAGPNPKSTTNIEVESMPCRSVYRVAFDGRSETADDLSWAAVKAALASLPSGGAR